MLYHTGMRALFPAVSSAISQLIPIEDLRWISFSHVEADECGSMNQFLAAAPHAQVVHGPLAVSVSLNDLADRAPHVIDDAPLDLGAKRLRFIATPHVPHNWESGVWFDETTGTLFNGDLFTTDGDRPPLTEDDLVEAALHTEDVFHFTSHSPQLLVSIERLAALEPTTLALMHGSSFNGDGGEQLRSLAAAYRPRIGMESPSAA